MCNSNVQHVSLTGQKEEGLTGPPQVEFIQIIDTTNIQMHITVNVIIPGFIQDALLPSLSTRSSGCVSNLTVLALMHRRTNPSRYAANRIRKYAAPRISFSDTLSEIKSGI